MKAVQSKNTYDVSTKYAKSTEISSEIIEKNIIAPLNTGYNLSLCSYADGKNNGNDGGIVTATCPLKKTAKQVTFQFMTVATNDGLRVGDVKIAGAK